MLGKLLREVQPELMDELIQATKDGDQSRLQALSGSVLIGEDDEEAEESEFEEEEVPYHILWNLLNVLMSLEPYSILFLEWCLQGSDECINMATRWCEGLISKDIKITNEVYSIRSVEFDRQVTWIHLCSFDYNVVGSFQWDNGIVYFAPYFLC